MRAPEIFLYTVQLSRYSLIFRKTPILFPIQKLNSCILIHRDMHTDTYIHTCEILVSTAGGVRSTSVLRAESLQKQKCNRRARASDQPPSTRRTSGPRTGRSFRPRGWYTRYAHQSQSCVYLFAGRRLQTTTA